MMDFISSVSMPLVLGYSYTSHMSWRNKAWKIERVGNGRAHLHMQRHHARPDWQRIIFLIVPWPAGANFRRGFAERQRHHRRRLEFLALHRPQNVPAAGKQRIDKDFEADFLLVIVGDLARRAEHHHRAVISGMVEG